MLPFAGGITAASNGLLVFSAIAASVYLAALKHPLSLKRAIIKTITVFLLGVIAWQEGGPAALIIGLFLAAFGDFCLATPGEYSFQIGLSGFLGAQLAYVVLFVEMTNEITFVMITEPWRAMLAVIAIAHTARFGAKLWGHMPNELRPQVIAYAMIITLMSVTALGVANPVVIAGVALFVISDTLIGYEKFIWPRGVDQYAWSEPAVWISYCLAQALITLGILL